MNIEKEKIRLNAMLVKVQDKLHPLLEKEKILQAQISLFENHGKEAA